MAYPYSTQQIKGTARQIKLQVVFSNPAFTQGQLYYKIDNTSPSYNTANAPSTYSFTAINNNGTILINPNQYLTFSLVGTGSPASTYVNVVNISDNYKRVGRFLADVQTPTGGGNTPNPAIDFDNASGSAGSAETNQETILGLSSTIDIEVFWTESGGPAPFHEFYVYKNGSPIQLTSQGEIVTVSNDDTLRFVLLNDGPVPFGLDVSLINASDNYNPLDVFSIEAYNSI